MSSTLSSLSTHVLDAAYGVPAAGLDVVLHDTTGPIARGGTDADGRIRFDVALGPGAHRLVFATGAWFAAADRATFFPEVDVAFDVDPGLEHHHVALLLSPFSYTTYRGS